jgi:hypothetical protein
LVVLDGLEEEVDEVPEIGLMEEAPIINISNQRLFQIFIEGIEK